MRTSRASGSESIVSLGMMTRSKEVRSRRSGEARRGWKSDLMAVAPRCIAGQPRHYSK